jgi:3-oxoadipate enol-lactonase
MNAVALHHRLDGPPEAPLLVLGASLGTTTDLWHPQLAALARDRRVLRYDHRGHGGSPTPAGPYRIADLGGDLLALLDRLGEPRVELAGISLGAMVATWLAAHAPDRVRRLALLSTSALLGPAQGWLDRATAVRVGGPGAVADTVVGRWFTPAFRDREPATVGWARGMLLHTPAEGYAGCCEAIAAMDLTPVLGRITAPTLVIGAAGDPATPPEHGRRLAAGIPGARFALVDGAHLANVERPDAVTALLTGFLSGGST